jgi:hypothetical protein
MAVIVIDNCPVIPGAQSSDGTIRLPGDGHEKSSTPLKGKGSGTPGNVVYNRGTVIGLETGNICLANIDGKWGSIGSIDCQAEKYKYKTSNYLVSIYHLP